MPGFESSACALVFIHLGPAIPSYTALALAQARLFNRMPILSPAGLNAATMGGVKCSHPEWVVWS